MALVFFKNIFSNYSNFANYLNFSRQILVQPKTRKNLCFMCASLGKFRLWWVKEGIYLYICIQLKLVFSLGNNRMEKATSMVFPRPYTFTIEVN